MLEVILYTTLLVIAVSLLMMVRQVVRVLNKYQLTPAEIKELEDLPDSELPSVSVCIPARNEQHALTDSLLRVLSSTYDKLEIIVLDDVSGDDTSALIKSFASEGVRFVRGLAPEPGWLGKNHALEGLLKEASGTYVLYMGVDTMLSPEAIETMMRYAVSSHASMVSVLPRREDQLRASVVFSPLRFFWEVLFARRQRPATAGGAWLIRRDVLQDRFGGFEGFKNTVQPETKIAAELSKSGEYRFLVGTQWLGVAFEKKWTSQLSTSIRLLSPLLSNQLSMSLFAVIDLVVLFLLPLTLTLLWFMGIFTPLPMAILAGVISVGHMLLYMYYTRRLWRRGWFIGGLILPIIVIQEIVLIVTSFVLHSLGKVKWKGRLIRPEVQS